MQHTIALLALFAPLALAHPTPPRLLPLVDGARYDYALREGVVSSAANPDGTVSVVCKQLSGAYEDYVAFYDRSPDGSLELRDLGLLGQALRYDAMGNLLVADYDPEAPAAIPRPRIALRKDAAPGVHAERDGAKVEVIGPAQIETPAGRFACTEVAVVTGKGPGRLWLATGLGIVKFTDDFVEGLARWQGVEPAPGVRTQAGPTGAHTPERPARLLGTWRSEGGLYAFFADGSARRARDGALVEGSWSLSGDRGQVELGDETHALRLSARGLELDGVACTRAEVLPLAAPLRALAHDLVGTWRLRAPGATQVLVFERDGRMLQRGPQGTLAGTWDVRSGTREGFQLRTAIQSGSGVSRSTSTYTLDAEGLRAELGALSVRYTRED